MVSIGPFLLTMLNHEYSNFQKSQKFQSVSHNFNNILISSASFHISKTQSSKKRKPWINLTSEQRPATVTTSVVPSIKTYRIGLMLVEKQTSLSTKPKPIAGRICCTSPCQILMVQMFGRLFEVSTAPQIPTHPMRPCRITALNYR